MDSRRNKAIKEYWKGLGEKLKADMDAFNKSHPDRKRCEYYNDDVNEGFTFTKSLPDFLCFRLYWDDLTCNSAKVEVTERELDGDLPISIIPIPVEYRIFDRNGNAVLTASDGDTSRSYEDVKAVLLEFLEKYTG
jgi:hypothetical protein